MITPGRPVCRLAPEGHVPPATCSGALSLASGVGSRAIATGSGVPIPFPLRPGCFCRSRRACRVRRDAPSLKFPATGADSSREPPGLPGPDREDEETVAAVRGSGVGSAKARPLRVIPNFGQVSEDFREAARAERGDVLQVDVTGSKAAKAVGDVQPQSTAGSFRNAGPGPA